MIFFKRMLTAVLFVALLTGAGQAHAQYNAFEDPGKASSDGATAGPDLKAVNQQITAGNVSVGSTVYVIALFENKGTGAVKVGDVKLYPSSTISADVSLNQCAKDPLPPGATCAITVSVSALKVGAWRVEMLVDHNGKTRLATAILNGNVDAGASGNTSAIETDIEAKPASIDFGSSKGGIPLVRSLTLRNISSEKVDLKDVQIDAPSQTGFAMKTQCPSTLESGQACLVAITWTPLSKGKASGSLIVQHSGKGSLTQVDVTGDFTPDASKSATIYPESLPDKGLLVASMEKVDFGSDIKGVSAITVSLVNAGDSDLTLTGIKLSGSDSGLSVARTGCRAGTVLTPVAACPLTINWLPSREGDVIDDLQITHNGARGILVIPVRGSAQKAVSRETMAIRKSPVSSTVSAVAPPPTAEDELQEAINREETAKGNDKPSNAADTDKKPGAAGNDMTPPPSDGPVTELPPTEELSDIINQKSSGKKASPPPPPLYGEDQDMVSVTPSLDGYVVTSHSRDRAVLAGPIGSQVVKDGKQVVISGVVWDVKIVETGVELTSAHDQMLLIFDRSLTPNRFGESDSSSSGGSDRSNSTTSGTSSNTNSSNTSSSNSGN